MFLAVVVCGGLGCRRVQLRPPELRTIKVGGATALVEIAASEEVRQKGLSRRKHLPDNRGMLFVSPGNEYQIFWMKDTFVPLSIAFIRSDGWIFQIEDMEPNTVTRHCSKLRAKYVLEMPKGWFERNGVSVGDYAEIPADIAELPFKD